MKPFLPYLVFLILFSIHANGQITSPDTACVNTPVNFYSQQQSTAYAWMLDSVSLNQTPGTLYQLNNGSASFNTLTFMSLNYDNGNYYEFVNNYTTGDMVRLNYGTSLNNVPTVTDLGNFGFTSDLCEGIDIVKDTDANAWYGLSVDDGQMAFVNFGSSLGNTPTATVMDFPNNLLWPHQLTIKKYNGQWIAFVGNRNGTISRFDFGTSLTNTPTAVNIPNIVNFPCDFAIHEQGGNWYMLINDLIDGTLGRFDFGTNLQNDTPSGTNLGNPGYLYNLPRGINILSNCNGDLYAYTVNEGGEFIKLNFNGDITTTPTVTDMGSVGYGTMNSMTAYSLNDSLLFLFTSYGNNAIYSAKMLSLPTPATTNFYNPGFTYTFTAPGIYNITLFNDQSYHAGGAAYCKQIVILGSGNYSTDTAVCQGTAVTLYTVPGANNWSTGATGDSITVTSSGTYWVSGSNMCGTISDTTHVAVNPIPQVNLGDDTAICENTSFLLHPSGNINNATYLWSTGSTGPFIQPTQSGDYWLELTENGCTGSDSISVTLLPLPSITLAPDLSFCQGDSIKVGTYPQPGYTYLWSTGNTQDSIEISQTGAYWLAATDTNGCLSADTISITANPVPDVQLGNDTSICTGTSITLGGLNNFNNAEYTWSTGDATATIQAGNAGTYWLQVNINGCNGSDTMSLAIRPVPIIALGNDTTFCAGDTVVLLPIVQSATHPTYTWNTGSNNSSITVSTPGAYRVSVSDSGCTASDSIFVRQLFPPQMNLGSDTTVCQGSALIVYANNSSDTSDHTLWSDGSTGNTFTITDAGTYYASSSNQCGTAADTITVDFEYCNIWFPSAFTPNNDGHNDIIKAVGGLNAITGYKLSIYNRWGQMVYETVNKESGWDGRFNGTDQPIDTYNYMIQYAFEGKSYLMKGNFELIR